MSLLCGGSASYNNHEGKQNTDFYQEVQGLIYKYVCNFSTGLPAITESTFTV